MKGNEAIAEAAIRAGCEAYFGYPITPQTEILEYMSRRMPELGRTFLQAESELAGHCTIALIDFDMPGENGLELAASLKDEPVEMMLFTGRQPQMQAFLAESGKSQEDFGIGLTMLKGAPAQELNDGVLTLLKARLDFIVPGSPHTRTMWPSGTPPSSLSSKPET